MMRRREVCGAGLSVAAVSRALLAVFASAVAVGYLAGTSFRPSPVAMSPRPLAPRWYAAVQPLLPQATNPQAAAQAPVPGWPVPPPTPIPTQATRPRGPLGTERFDVSVRISQGPAEAEAVAGELRRRGYAVHVDPGAGARVGCYLDLSTAEQLIKRLSGDGFDATLADAR